MTLPEVDPGHDQGGDLGGGIGVVGVARHGLVEHDATLGGGARERRVRHGGVVLALDDDGLGGVDLAGQAADGDLAGGVEARGAVAVRGEGVGAVNRDGSRAAVGGDRGAVGSLGLDGQVGAGDALV